MSYETILGISQVVAMVLFGSVLIGVFIHALRPANRQRFEDAARLPLRHEEGIGGENNGRE